MHIDNDREENKIESQTKMITSLVATHIKNKTNSLGFMLEITQKPDFVRAYTEGKRHTSISVG